MPVQAYSMQGQTCDCGNKLGFLLANVEYGLNAWLKQQDF
jgi:UTP-glucose-1-phosphate uridylyltransferase